MKNRYQVQVITNLDQLNDGERVALIDHVARILKAGFTGTEAEDALAPHICHFFVSLLGQYQGARLHIVAHDLEPVGYCFTDQGKAGEQLITNIQFIAVDPAHQHTRAARMLVDSAMEQPPLYGLARPKAVKFWKKRGFTVLADQDETGHYPMGHGLEAKPEFDLYQTFVAPGPTLDNIKQKLKEI
ncbi:GNAT family N-acetyltransferase [Thalassospira alkalitolerans]|uniref:GNAT family N-acetyltransferase n=1 Tax=Thalassospira alkalitolerans TaxID=1293890 RepID=UPI003AA857B0